MEERIKALKQGKEQFYFNLATVLQYIDLMRREEIGRKSKALKQRKEQCYNNLTNLTTVLQEIDLMRRETNGRKN